MSAGESDSIEGEAAGEECAEESEHADGAAGVEELGFDPTDPEKPVLIWDGDCGFCARSLLYIQERVGEALHYVPYQRVHEHFDILDVSDFERAVHLIEPNGVQSSGAEAIFRALDRAPGGGRAQRLYDHVESFARLSEAAYRFVAEHRPLMSSLTRWTIGDDLSPTRYRWARWLFMRMLAVVFLIAFASLGVQILGLVGSGGIEPAADTVDNLRRALDRPQNEFGALLWKYPTLYWWWQPTDWALSSACAGGGIFSVFLLGGVWPRLLLPVLWALYLSLVIVSGPFLGYQWDALLLESALLGWFLAPKGFWTLRSAPHVDRAPVWLFQWLAFRLVFMSGVEKLLGGDQTWWHLSALTYHFWTQPLPTWTAYWIHQLPTLLLYAGTFAVLVVEVVVPLLVFGPRRLKRWAAYAFIGLQVAIVATGNYTFFNLLTVVVCLLLIDDSVWAAVIPDGLADWVARPDRAEPGGWERVRGVAVAVLVAVVFAVTAVKMLDDFHGTAGEPNLGAPTFFADVAGWATTQAHAFDGFRSFNNYGLFVNMTTERPEILVQGTKNGETWKTYDFRWKPDALGERPRFVEPHQPRLDWQMWFQALRLERAYQQTQRCRPSPWFLRFQRRLLEGSPPVLGLLGENPFSDSPPNYIRVVVYDYEFAEPGTDDWWRRSNRRAYCPVFTLRADGAMRKVPAGRLSN